MTPEELSRVRDIYERAAPMTGPARDAFVERECGDQSGLRPEVERLLAARERIPEWLNQPALAEAKTFAGMELPKLEGRQIGGYTLIREIGRGGMGCVYLAERSDGSFHKQAAIKLVLPTANSAATIARFQQEREILASLDHPNIARLFDGGATEEGWPYFVMEYVEGQPIHRWCDDRKLNISQRLELFRGVLAAVRYAHQRLVVHRDLKPGNILVTGGGVVKLLDFGIAKIVAAGPGREPGTLTLADMMTPEYASPEQVYGAPITTLSDIYSLGVTLYELLTGHRPYRLLSAAVHEMARVIAEVEPPRPSEIVTTTQPRSALDRTEITPATVSAVREGDPHRLRKRLAGDLDSILLMSLQKEPERRYGSVESLAGDLEKHLNHLPINAREATVWERMRRFWRRNPGAVVAGILVAIPILTGLIAVTLQTRRELFSTYSPAHGVAPLLVVSFGIVCVGLGLALYLARPSRLRLIAAFAGGAVWTAAVYAKVWVGQTWGWWQSRVADDPDPLDLLNPHWGILVVMALTAAMFLLSWINRRFGPRTTMVFLVAACLYQIARERYWLSIAMPFLEFRAGWGAMLAESAIFGAGGLLGLWLMRAIDRHKL